MRPRSTNDRLRIEPLEDRMLMSTCIVTRRSDGGGGMGFRGDLRYCINKVNAEPGADEIVIPVTGQINLTAPLPELTEDLVINGPGASLMEIRRNSGGDYRIFTAANGVIEIEGLTVSNGVSDVGGGIYNQASLTLTDVIVSSNLSTSGVGGGIYNAGTLIVEASQVSDNSASSTNLGFGGGIYNLGSAQVMDSKMERNLAAASCTGGPCVNQTAGGGIAINAILSVDRSTISGNRIVSGNTPQSNTVFGLGIYSAGTATIDSSAITLNIVSVGFSSQGRGAGGGIYNTGPSMTIANSTIAANDLRMEGGSATSEGGGIYNAAGNLTVTHSTIADNVLRCLGAGASTRAGGGISIRGGTVHVKNSLFGDNGDENDSCIPASFPGRDIFGALSSSSYNLFEKSSGGSGFDSTDILDVDPGIGPLMNNGGPTNTIALLPSSLAIDSGDNTGAPAFDQRGPGFARIANGTIDRGAFEVQSTAALAISRLSPISWADFSVFLATADFDLFDLPLLGGDDVPFYSQ